jgi:hypothetical protein
MKILTLTLTAAALLIGMAPQPVPTGGPEGAGGLLDGQWLKLNVNAALRGLEGADEAVVKINDKQTLYAFATFNIEEGLPGLPYTLIIYAEIAKNVWSEEGIGQMVLGGENEGLMISLDLTIPYTDNAPDGAEGIFGYHAQTNGTWKIRMDKKGVVKKAKLGGLGGIVDFGQAYLKDGTATEVVGKVVIKGSLTKVEKLPFDPNL